MASDAPWSLTAAGIRHQRFGTISSPHRCPVRVPGGSMPIRVYERMVIASHGPGEADTGSGCWLAQAFALDRRCEPSARNHPSAVCLGDRAGA